MAFPNGIAISADEKTLYVAETMRNAVWAVGLEEPGVMTQRRARILAYLPGGGVGPDGMAVDEQGNLYVAYFDAGEVVVFTGKGKLIGAIKLPAGEGTFTTNVTFGGLDRKTLYITEADKNVIYKVAMKVRGLKLFGDKE